MKFYNSQWLIKDFGKLWPSIRFEYGICIFIIIEVYCNNIVITVLMMTMMCVDVQDVYKVEKEKVLLGKRLVFITLDFD